MYICIYVQTSTNSYFHPFSHCPSFRSWLHWSSSQRWSVLLFTPPGDPHRSQGKNAEHCSVSRFLGTFSCVFGMFVVLVITVVDFFHACLVVNLLFQGWIFFSNIFVLILSSIRSADAVQSSKFVKTKTSHFLSAAKCLSER